jgi:hypothetical protein
MVVVIAKTNLLRSRCCTVVRTMTEPGPSIGFREEGQRFSDPREAQLAEEPLHSPCHELPHDCLFSFEQTLLLLLLLGMMVMMMDAS